MNIRHANDSDSSICFWMGHSLGREQNNGIDFHIEIKFVQQKQTKLNDSKRQRTIRMKIINEKQFSENTF